jgi:hypothetical protein
LILQRNILFAGDNFCEKCMAVASDNDVCTNIGAEILKKGGSAVDATISILLCLGAVQPESNGIGGWVSNTEFSYTLTSDYHKYPNMGIKSTA